jgi:phenylacetate-CoA ligase
MHSRPQLDAAKLSRLNDLLATILPSDMGLPRDGGSANTFYAAKLARLPHRLESLDELAEWPFTFKDELVDAAARLGRPANLTWPTDRYVRFHQTSGTHGRPLPVFDTADDWEWWLECWRTVFARGGVGEGDRVFVASAFGPTVAFWSAFDAAVSVGAMAIPTGGVRSIARLEMLRSLAATVLVSTPSYCLHLAELAEERKIDLAALPVRLVIVAGEPGGSIPSTRTRIAEAYGAAVLDHAGASEVGAWGVGSPDGRALEVIEPYFHPEFLSLATGGPAGTGELAELVLTTLGRAGCPVFRYRTGDLVRPCWPTETRDGETPWVRLEGGILGRTDDMLTIRGVNVFPGAVDDIVRSFPEVIEYRLTVSSRESLDELSLEIEDRLENPRRVEEELRIRLGLRVAVRTVPIGSLPRFEGKGRRVIDTRQKAAP